jgi:phosphoribosylformylglycinamidine synthase PurS subunit
MKATVHVFLKPGVLDVQGKAVEAALHGLGWADVSNARVGRTIEFDLAETDAAKAETEVKAMCDKLLANTVIESYRVESPRRFRRGPRKAPSSRSGAFSLSAPSLGASPHHVR